MTKCCSTCCNRISRKLATLSGGSATSATDGNGTPTPAVAPSEKGPAPSPVRAEEAPAAAGAAPAAPRERSSASSCDDEAMPAEKPPSQAELLLPPRAMPEPRPLVKVLQPGADNSETDSADEIGANHIAANAEAQLGTVHPPQGTRSNGNIGQVRHSVCCRVFESSFK